jgi:hypothetical protein
MKKTTLFAFLAAVWITAAPASAGAASTGQMTTVTEGTHLSSRARKLLGSWRLTAIRMGAHRRPVPAGIGVQITFHANGTAEAVMHRRGPAPKKTVGTWKVKGNRLSFKARAGSKGATASVKNTLFQVNGKELILTLGTGKHVQPRLILTRVTRKP